MKAVVMSVRQNARRWGRQFKRETLDFARVERLGLARVSHQPPYCATNAYMQACYAPMLLACKMQEHESMQVNRYQF